MDVRNSCDDLTLIDSILSGDTSACRTLVERHKSYAFTIAFRILNNRENAEEAAQDAFVQAFRNLSSFSREAKFTTWFYRIVFNAALMVKRKDKGMEVELEAGGQLFSEDSLSNDIQTHERQFFIQQSMQLLSPEDATLLTLFYLKEHSLEELAEITGTTAANAKVRLHRARQRLAKHLETLLKTEARNLL